MTFRPYHLRTITLKFLSSVDTVPRFVDTADCYFASERSGRCTDGIRGGNKRDNKSHSCPEVRCSPALGSLYVLAIVIPVYA